MANPYVVVNRELNIVSGSRAPAILSTLKPPKPPIRQLPLPVVLIPGVRTGG